MFPITPHVKANSWLDTEKRFFGVKMGDDRIYRPIDLKGIHPPPKHVFWCIGRRAMPFRVSWNSAQGTKNKKAQVSTSPLRPEDTLFGLPTKFCMWAKFTDVINCAKYYLHWLSHFSAPGVRKSQFSLCMDKRSYNSVRTNVLHYDILFGFTFNFILAVN